MSNFFHLTLLVAALALLISSSCIQLAPAQIPPFSLPPCSLNSSWISEKAPIAEQTRNLTLFRLSFLTNQSVSFTFTATFNDSTEDGAPYPAFVILVRLPLQADPSGYPCLREQYSFSQPLRLHVCNPVAEQTQAPTSCLSEPAYPYDSNDTGQFKDELSLIYDAATTEIHQQRQVFYSGEFLLNETFSHDLQPDGVDSRVSNDSLTVFVGYISTGWEGSITVTNNTNKTTGVPPMNSSAPPTHSSLSLPVVLHDDDAKSSHEKLLVGLIVGVSVLALLMGSLILVLFIAKRRRHRCPPSLVSSRLAAGGSLGAPPLSTTSKSPLSHQDLETSTATPVMKALALSPPHNIAAVQSTATASWLKPPNPR